MPVPNTRGFLRYHILDMEIGDYFPMQIGEADGSGSGNDYLIKPFDWEAWGKNVWKEELKWKKGDNNDLADGVFYFIKVDDGLLIADRVVKTNISQHKLKIDVNNYVQGVYMIVDGVEGVMRLPTGGIAWHDGNGKPTYTSPKNFYGAYPTDNEYDKYIVNSNLGGKVSPNDDNVWHNNGFETVTSMVNSKIVSQAIHRGGGDDGANLIYRVSTDNASNAGFRPVFDYGYKFR